MLICHKKWVVHTFQYHNFIMAAAFSSPAAQGSWARWDGGALRPQQKAIILHLKCCVLIFWFLQVLVEKLLRSCPGIKNIYLLMRPKRGQEVAVRLNELLNSPVSSFASHLCLSLQYVLCLSSHWFVVFFFYQLFDKIRQDKQQELSKVIPICGDITSEELGISESDQVRTLYFSHQMPQYSWIFHSEFHVHMMILLISSLLSFSRIFCVEMYQLCSIQPPLLNLMKD